jgi:hypothetical protein
MAYRPADYQNSEDPHADDPVAAWVARHRATAPPFTESQRRHIAYLLSHQGDT